MTTPTHYAARNAASRDPLTSEQFMRACTIIDKVGEAKTRKLLRDEGFVTFNHIPPHQRDRVLRSLEFRTGIS